MTDTQVQTKGRGFIRVQANDELLAGLGNPETPEQWHKALLLPDSYEVERVEQVGLGASGYVFHIFVQSDAIPPLEDHTPMTEVVPYYGATYKTEDGIVNKQPMLMRIEINQWKNERWENVAMQVYHKNFPIAQCETK